MENSRENKEKLDSNKKVYVTCQRKLEVEVAFTVADFLNLKKQVKSPAIKVGLCSWQIAVIPDQESLNVSVKCSSESEDKSWSCIAEYELAMINHKSFKENFIRKPRIPRKFTPVNCMWGFVDFLKGSTISELEEGFIDAKGSVTFHANIKAEDPDGIECKMPCTLMELSEAFSDANINPLTANYELTDVVLCIDNDKIHCHRFILAMASKVFKRMFATDMNESKSKEVSLKEIDVETLKSFLMFVYQHKIDSNKINLKLLAAADMYEVLCLRKICNTHLSKNLSIENVAEIWFAAYLHNIEDLANDSVVWMAENWEILKNDKQFLKWAKEHPDLPIKIATVLADKCKTLLNK